MPTLYTNEMIEIIKNEYPDSDNEVLSNKLGISQSSLRWKASRLGIRKSDVFMKQYYLRLQENKKIKHEQNYKNYEMNNIERNIIIGSLLGDGTLSKYGRSLNACYRENTGISQIEYRKWKADKLKNLDFKINSNGGIYSPSHPIYTELYKMFYPNNFKIIPKDELEMLNHPIGLACLFMDDGSLVINNYKKSHSITLFPQILLYSQSFTREENIMLMEHINETFNIEFKLSKRKDGSNYILKINKRNEVYKFLEIVKPYFNEIPNIRYKINVDSKLIDTHRKYVEKYKDKIIKISNRETFDNTYSPEEETRIIEMINDGVSYKSIAESLDRPYYGLYNKVRRMKENELI
ncbi:hypothetical protein [Tissierella praeacuta]|uniref:hypothetical protein n=1 Tax=Tissierella praeacuta TaxID=43131 RepID=UPI00333FF1F2